MANEELKTYTEKEIDLSYKGRCISDREELGFGYCGSCSMGIHRNQLLDKTSWVHSAVDRWILKTTEATESTRQSDTGLIKALEEIIETSYLDEYGDHVGSIEPAKQALAKYRSKE